MSIVEDIRRLIAEGRLKKMPATLRGKQQECRLLYFETGAADRAKNLLRSAQTDGVIDGAATPRDQFFSLCQRYSSGDQFDEPTPHPMRPERDGIWRLRTADLRIIGWFPMQAVFIISEIELKVNCLIGNRDNELMEEAISMRNELSIGGGCFLTGGINDCL